MKIQPPAKRVVRRVRFRDNEWDLVRLAASEKELQPSTWLREAAISVARRQLARARAGRGGP